MLANARLPAAHRVPYDHVDIEEQPEAIERLQELEGGRQIIPLVDFGNGTHEANPSDETLAGRIGLAVEADRSADDLVIIGGGPAGSASPITPLGRASTPSSSMPVLSEARPGSVTASITTPGSPTGSRGVELADRFVAQARRYGVQLLSAVSVTAVELDGQDLVTSLPGQQLACTPA